MERFLEVISTKEVFIALGIVGGLLVVYFIYRIYKLMQKRAAQKNLHNNTMELNKLVEEVAKAQGKEAPTNTSKQEAKVVATEKNTVSPTVVETPKVEEVSVQEEKNEKIEKKEEKIEEPKAKITLGSMVDIPIEILEPDDKKEAVSLKKEEQDLQYKDEVYTKEEAKEELERITQELKLQEIKEEKAKKNKEEVEETLDEKSRLTEFEEKQEEDAIISLQELLEKGKQITAMNEEIQYQDEGNEPISIRELEQRYYAEKAKEDQKETPVVEERVSAPVVESTVSVQSPTATPKEKITLSDFHSVKVEPYHAKSTYKPSPVISPIYGIEEEKSVRDNNTLSLENTANYEKLDEEIRKTNEFLSQLRELQQKLD